MRNKKNYNKKSHCIENVEDVNEDNNLTLFVLRVNKLIPSESIRPVRTEFWTADRIVLGHGFKRPLNRVMLDTFSRFRLVMFDSSESESNRSYTDSWTSIIFYPSSPSILGPM